MVGLQAFDRTAGWKKSTAPVFNSFEPVAERLYSSMELFAGNKLLIVILRPAFGGSRRTYALRWRTRQVPWPQRAPLRMTNMDYGMG